MRQTRICCPVITESDQLILEGEAATHLLKVLRLRNGDAFVAFDGSGVEVQAELVQTRPQVIARITQRSWPLRESSCGLVVYLAVVKGERFDWAVEKLTELGVAAIVPMLSAYTQIQNPSVIKLERWQRLAVAAACQCGRVRLPEICQPQSFSEACHAAKGQRVLLLPGQSPLTAASCGEVSVIVGPEGGFADSEVELAVARGFTLASLGARVLRVETAALAAASRLLVS